MDLNDERFSRLSKDECLELLRIVSDKSAPENDRKAAKDKLIEAHMKLMAWTINRVLPKQESPTPGNALGIEDFSDVLDSAAGHVFEELTNIATELEKGSFQFTTAIVIRVQRRIYDKIRNLKAQKRTAQFDSANELETVTDSKSSLLALESMILKESAEQLRVAIEMLDVDETARNVLLVITCKLKDDELLTVTEAADILGIAKSTARSAFERARRKLEEWLSDKSDPTERPD